MNTHYDKAHRTEGKIATPIMENLFLFLLLITLGYKLFWQCHFIIKPHSVDIVTVASRMNGAFYGLVQAVDASRLVMTYFSHRKKVSQQVSKFSRHKSLDQLTQKLIEINLNLHNHDYNLYNKIFTSIH